MKKMKKINSNILKKTAFIIFTVFCTVTIVKLQLDYNQLKNEKELLTNQRDAMQDNIVELQNTIDMPFNDEYVIKIAKQKLNLRLPEEIVFFNDLTE